MGRKIKLLASQAAAKRAVRAGDDGMPVPLAGGEIDLPEAPEQIAGRAALDCACGFPGEVLESLQPCWGWFGGHRTLAARGAGPMAHAFRTNAFAWDIERANGRDVTRGADQQQRARRTVAIRDSAKVGDAEARQAANPAQNKAGFLIQIRLEYQEPGRGGCSR